MQWREYNRVNHFSSMWYVVKLDFYYFIWTIKSDLSMPYSHFFNGILWFVRDFNSNSAFSNCVNCVDERSKNSETNSSEKQFPLPICYKTTGSPKDRSAFVNAIEYLWLILFASNLVDCIIVVIIFLGSDFHTSITCNCTYSLIIGVNSKKSKLSNVNASERK